MKVKLLSRARLLATPWTAAHQAPLSMGFSRQECWRGLPLPSPITPYLIPIKRQGKKTVSSPFPVLSYLLCCSSPFAQYLQVTLAFLRLFFFFGHSKYMQISVLLHFLFFPSGIFFSQTFSWFSFALKLCLSLCSMVASS